MVFTLWFVVAGALLMAIALSGSVLRRLPLTSAVLYLGAGIALGPLGAGLFDLDPFADAGFVERVTEFAVIVSLFTAGLKLRVPGRDERWRLPLRLAFVSMAITVGLVALIGTVGLGLPLGAAVLLGAVLAPTDPVLASDVQVEHPGDRDRLRFALTGEAGLNDGTAFPFVMLGLGLLGLHDLGGFGWRWAAVDVAWATLGGLAIGGVLGTAVGYLVVYLRKTHAEAVGTDDFLALGLIALAYGAALLAHGYGFLAVFAAGWALGRIERRSEERAEAGLAGAAPGAAGGAGGAGDIAGAERGDDFDPATHPETAPAHLAEAVLGFNEQLERIGEVAVVVILGGMLIPSEIPLGTLWFVPVLFLLVRPLAVWAGLRGSRSSFPQRRLIAWFGIRGIGSVYYLSYAFVHGVEEGLARELAGITLATIAASVVVHGVSVTPLMGWYGARSARAAPAGEAGGEGLGARG